MKKYFALAIFVWLTLGMTTATSSSYAIKQEIDSSRVSSEEIVYASDVARDVYDDVTTSSYRDLIIELTSIGPRPYGSENNTQARDWIVSKIRDLTDNKIRVSVFGQYGSIIARLPGTAGEHGPCLMVGGHYDSVHGAPGANDDGTGVATALELARVLSKREWPIDIIFGFWNAEELGLLGSEEAARSFAANNTDILAYYNVDMLLVQDPNRPADERVDIAYYDGADAVFHDALFWAELTRVMNSNLDSPIINPRPHYGFQYWDYSDHRSFQSAGYKGVLFAFETGTHLDEAYHTSQDTWDNPDYDYGIAADTVSSIGASIAFVLATPQGQKTMERRQYSIPANDEVEYFIEITMPTTLEISYNWTGSATPLFELIDPEGEPVISPRIQTAVSSNLISFSLDEFGMYELQISNTEESSSNLDIIFSYDMDVDGNRVSDSMEPWLSGFLKDTDNDSLSDAEEEFMGTNKLDPDSDSDNLMDGDEVYNYGTSPGNPDTDFDEMPDGFEVLFGLDPLRMDGYLDLDEDGLSNALEYQLGTLVNDTDSDHDSMPDSWELDMGLDPLDSSDALQDEDGDWLANSDEYRFGLDPNRWDNIYLLIAVMFIPVLGIIIDYLRRKRIKA